MHEAMKEQLQSFLQSDNDPLMLVVGEAGSGKTRLLNETMEDASIHQHIIRLRGTANLQPSQLTDVLSEHWAATIRDKNARLESQLHEILLSLAEHNQSCALFVDDAQQLSYAVLAALCHLAIQQENKPIHLHLVLSGRPELNKKIQSLISKNIPQIVIGALTRSQAYQRMSQLLVQAKCDLKAATPDVFARIYQQTGGLPEAINLAMHAFIAQHEEKCIPQEKPTSQVVAIHRYWEMHRVKSAAVVGLILMAFVAWKVQHHQTSLPWLSHMAITKHL